MCKSYCNVCKKELGVCNCKFRKDLNYGYPPKTISILENEYQNLIKIKCEMDGLCSSLQQYELENNSLKNENQEQINKIFKVNQLLDKTIVQLKLGCIACNKDGLTEECIKIKCCVVNVLQEYRDFKQEKN